MTYNKALKYAPTPSGVSAGHYTAAASLCFISFSHKLSSFVSCRLMRRYASIIHLSIVMVNLGILASGKQVGLGRGAQLISNNQHC